MLNTITGMLAGGVPLVTDYESIQSVTVGAGGASSVSFTSIPSTYSHLQIRFIARDARAATQDSYTIKLNSDSGSNYYPYHELYGDGSTAASYNFGGAGTSLSFDRITGANATSGIFGAGVVDILDYANTNKYKTARFLGGADLNGSGAMAFGSGLWMSTAAISQIDIAGAGGNWVQYSSFALYGIK